MQSGVAVLVIALVVGAGCGGGDSHPSSTSPSSAVTTPAASTTASGPEVVIHLTGKTPSSDSVRGGGGSGTFTASGVLTDSGRFLDYRRDKGYVIVIRRVLMGKNGKLTMLIRISKTSGDKGWKIVTSSGSYEGSQGTGEETGGVDSAGNLDITMNGSVTRP